MKSKILTTLTIFAVLALILIPSCFAATVLETPKQYGSDGAYIFGSTRFNGDTVLDATAIYNAGVNESKVWVALGNNINDLVAPSPYYYNGATWYKLTPGKAATAVTNKTEVQKIEDNLHIFFVGTEEKKIEVSFDGTVDEGSVTDRAVYDEENKKFIVPALSFDFEFTSDGAEVKVETNVDTNKEEVNTGDDIVGPEIINVDVAAIGDVKYEDLTKAFAEAKEGETVKLLANVDIPTAIPVDKKVTLNLNGKTITAKNDPNGDGLFMVVTGGDLTIEGEGTLDAACTTNNYSMAIWAKETGKVTINGGTYTNVGAKSLNAAGKTNNNDLIYARGNAVITINAGTFIGNTANVEYGPRFTLNLKDTERETSAIIVKGGTYTAFDPANNLAEGPNTNFVAEGYKSVYNEAKNTYTVVARDAADNVTNEEDLRYHMLNGGTVKLGSDIELAEKSIGLSKDVVLDLNGHKISISENYSSNNVIWTSAKLTVKGNGTIDTRKNEEEYFVALYAYNGGDITIENGTFIGIPDAEEASDIIYARGNGSKVTINDGTFIGDETFTLNLYDSDREVASIIVKGGTFKGFDPANNLAEGPNTNFVAEGYKSVYDEATNTYTVVAYDANNVTEEAELKHFMTEGGTVKLGSDIELAEKSIGLSKDVVLDLNGHKISISENYSSNNVIWTSAKLTVKGNGTIDTRKNEEEYFVALYAYNGGDITIENGTFIGIPDAEVPSDIIYARGNGSKVTINDGTFIGDETFTLNLYDSDREVASIIVKGGTFKGFDPANNLAEGEGTNFVAEGYVSNFNEAANTYTVVAAK